MNYSEFLIEVMNEEEINLFIQACNSRLAQKIFINKPDDLSQYDQLLDKIDNFEFQDFRINNLDRTLYKICPYIKEKTSSLSTKKVAGYKSDLVIYKLDSIFSLVFAYLVYKHNRNNFLSVIEINRKMRNFIDHAGGPIYFLRLDIKNFYESIPHEKLLSQIKSTENSIFQIVQKYVLKFKKQYNLDKGLPTGIDLTTGLADYYLKPLDNYIYKSKNISAFRYVDDIVVLGTSSKSVFSDAKNFILKTVENLGLELNLEKTTEGILNQNGFEYLGYTHLPDKCRVSDKTLDNIKSVYSRLIKDNNYNYEEKISLLNRKIRGHFIPIQGLVGFKGPVGVTPFFRIASDLIQINNFEKWFGKLAGKIFFEAKSKNDNCQELKLESFKKWFFKYKKSYRNTSKEIFKIDFSDYFNPLGNYYNPDEKINYYYYAPENKMLQQYNLNFEFGNIADSSLSEPYFIEGNRITKRNERHSLISVKSGEYDSWSVYGSFK